MNTVFRGFRSTGISPGDRTLFMPDSEELAPAIRAGVCKKSGGHYAGILRHRRREVISQHTHMHFPATENSWQSGNNRNFRGRNMSLPAARQALTTGIRRFSGNVRIFLPGHRSPHLRRSERQIRSLRNTWSCQLHPERSPKLPGWGSIKRTGTVGGSPAYAETVGE